MRIQPVRRNRSRELGEGPKDGQEQGFCLRLLPGPEVDHPGSRQLERNEAAWSIGQSGPRPHLQAAQGTRHR